MNNIRERFLDTYQWLLDTNAERLAGMADEIMGENPQEVIKDFLTYLTTAPALEADMWLGHFKVEREKK